MLEETQTQLIEPTLSQYKATAKFHRRMEKAYRSVGRVADAERAHKAAEALEAKVAEIVMVELFGELVAAEVVDRDEDGRVYVQTFPGSEVFCMKPEQVQS